MKFCNKHGGKIVSYVTICERDFKTSKFKKIRTICPVCDKILERKVITEKYILDTDMVYFRERLIESLGVPARFFQ